MPCLSQAQDISLPFRGETQAPISAAGHGMDTGGGGAAAAGGAGDRGGAGGVLRPLGFVSGEDQEGGEEVVHRRRDPREGQAAEEELRGALLRDPERDGRRSWRRGRVRDQRQDLGSSARHGRDDDDDCCEEDGDQLDSDVL